MSDRAYFKQRAEAERAVAQSAQHATSFHRHMELAREYEWLAVTEPYPESGASEPVGQGSSLQTAEHR